MYLPFVMTVLVATAAAPESAAAHARPSRKAVVVGINRYDAHPSENRDPLNRLFGSVPDANAMADLLRTRFHFDKVQLLTDDLATREGILQAIQGTLVDGAKRGDVRVFYFSGHGSQVGNTASRELDKLDETIVPYDYATASDLRDKELARALGGAVDKGAALTVILDTCHSGSGLRGSAPANARVAPVDPRTVSDPGAPVPLEQRGALVLSAAQDEEYALEVKAPELRGAFTFALAEALSTGGDEPARRIFLRAALRMTAFTSQTPVLAGTPQRQGATIFDSAPATIGARVEVPVRPNGDQIEVDAGLALGLGVGSVLSRRVEGQPELKLEVTSLEGATKAFASVSEGDRASLGDGGLFEVAKWAAVPGSNLVVHVPQGIDSRKLERCVADLEALRKGGRIDWVDAATPPTHGFTWEPTAKGPRWILHEPDGKQRALTSAELRAWKPPAGPRPRVLAVLPPPLALADALRARWSGSGGLVVVTPSSSDAHYRLTGRIGEHGAEYAWSRASRLDNGPALPARTDYYTASAAQGGADAAAWALGDSAERIARAYEWFNLHSAAADDEAFPFRLVLRRADGALRRDGDRAQGGEVYGFVLEPAGSGTAPVERRYVYVFALDSFGKRTLLFPPLDRGDVENHLPLPDKEQERVQRERMDLEDPRGGGLFTVSPPYGTDTYFLFASKTKLADPAVLDEEGVRTRGKGPQTDALLLDLLTPQLRGYAPRAPPSWTVQHIAIDSVEQGP